MLASIPTAIIGLAFEDLFEQLFHSLTAVGVAFACTGLLLRATRWVADGEHDVATVPWSTALWIGLAQGLAITPGISRSGATIAVAMLLGVRRDVAVMLSFLMSIPAITGAVLLKLRDVELGSSDPTQLLVGSGAAMVTGYAALVLLVALVRRGRFADFSWYLAVVSVVALGLGLSGLA